MTDDLPSTVIPASKIKIYIDELREWRDSLQRREAPGVELSPARVLRVVMAAMAGNAPIDFGGHSIPDDMRKVLEEDFAPEDKPIIHTYISADGNRYHVGCDGNVIVRAEGSRCMECGRRGELVHPR